MRDFSVGTSSSGRESRLGPILGYVGLIGMIVIGVLVKASGTLSLAQSVVLLIGYFVVLGLVGAIVALIDRR